MGSRKLRGQAFVAVAVLLLLAWWAFPPQHLEIEPVATSDEGSPPVAPAAPSEVDSDPYTADLAALQELAAKLDSEPSGEDADALRESLATHARSIVEGGIRDGRVDVMTQVGSSLTLAGEVDFAGALLQRAVGLLDAEAVGKDHLYALASVRRAQRRPIEAASLFERAVHVEPTTASEFVGLSDQYLAADRIGPARAAVTRGLRVHPEDAGLTVQGAKVMLLSGRSEQAIDILQPILAAEPSNLGARVVQLEALLASGRLEEASSQAEALREDAPDFAWGWIHGAAASAAQGDAAEELLEQAREIAGDCACTREEREAIAWAADVGLSQRVSPRGRAEIDVSAEGASAGSAPRESGRSPR